MNTFKFPTTDAFSIKPIYDSVVTQNHNPYWIATFVLNRHCCPLQTKFHNRVWSTATRWLQIFPQNFYGNFTLQTQTSDSEISLKFQKLIKPEISEECMHVCMNMREWIKKIYNLLPHRLLCGDERFQFSWSKLLSHLRSKHTRLAGLRLWNVHDI